MVKVESNMLVLDTTFTKEDVEAINYFVDIARKQERERIIEALDFALIYDEPVIIQRYQLVALIKGEK